MLYLNRFPRMTIGMLPTSYLESLTYLEQILCINKKLCEIITYLDEYSFENIENLINEQIQQVKEYVDTQNKLLYNYIDTEINNTQNYVDNQLNSQVALLKALIDEKVIFLIEYINNENTILKNFLLSELDALKAELDEIIINGIDVYDPTSGQYNNIQDVIYNLYKYLRYYGITAIQFDNSGISAKNFDALNLTAREFDLYSKLKLTIDFIHNMFSPFTGQITSLQNVINELASLHMQNITAGNFDDLDLTAQNFDNKLLSAYQFDWNSSNLLNV